MADCSADSLHKGSSAKPLANRITEECLTTFFPVRMHSLGHVMFTPKIDIRTPLDHILHKRYENPNNIVLAIRYVLCSLWLCYLQSFAVTIFS